MVLSIAWQHPQPPRWEAQWWYARSMQIAQDGFLEVAMMAVFIS
jgi:hypothetical protein